MLEIKYGKFYDIPEGCVLSERELVGRCRYMYYYVDGDGVRRVFPTREEALASQSPSDKERAMRELAENIDKLSREKVALKAKCRYLSEKVENKKKYMRAKVVDDYPFAYDPIYPHLVSKFVGLSKAEYRNLVLYHYKGELNKTIGELATVREKIKEMTEDYKTLKRRVFGKRTKN